MIYIVQVFPYQTNNGCSVRVGKGVDYDTPLKEHQCSFFDFVETDEEVKRAIRAIKRLPCWYRHKRISVQKLEEYIAKKHSPILIYRHFGHRMSRNMFPRLWFQEQTLCDSTFDAQCWWRMDQQWKSEH